LLNNQRRLVRYYCQATVGRILGLTLDHSHFHYLRSWCRHHTLIRPICRMPGDRHFGLAAARDAPQRLVSRPECHRRRTSGRSWNDLPFPLPCTKDIARCSQLSYRHNTLSVNSVLSRSAHVTGRPAPVLNALPPDHAAAGACTTIGFFTFLGRLLLFCSLLDIFESYAAISDLC